MKSSTEWVCDVCDSQLLPASSSGRFKNNLSRWMRTSEVEGWRSVADLELDTRLGMLWLSHLWNVMGKCKSLANTQLSACKTNDENAFESNLNTMQEKGEAGPKLISLRNMRKAVTTCVAGFKCWFFAKVFWQHLAKHCHIRKCSSHPRTPRCSCESYQISLSPDKQLQPATAHELSQVTKEKTGTVFFLAVWDKQTKSWNFGNGRLK